jgi:hypothetical protein
VVAFHSLGRSYGVFEKNQLALSNIPLKTFGLLAEGWGSISIVNTKSLDAKSKLTMRISLAERHISSNPEHHVNKEE